ncbi:MAG: RidA family protein [Dehalococcoidia bacterium]|nr:RidA family protein [Dehalococcoidia bacterium]
MGAEAKIVELNLDLSHPATPLGNYVEAVSTGNLVYLAGHGPRGAGPDGKWVNGKLGADMTVEQGYEAARLTGIGLLTTLRHEIGDLDRVTRIVKALCMVNATPDFGQHPAVANGFSDLMVEVFEERGRHARSAVGMQSLPNNIPFEAEMIVEVARE